MQDPNFPTLYAQISKLLNQIKDSSTSTSMYSILANIYTIDDNLQAFRYSKLSGILSVQIDRHFKSTFLRMYGLDSLDLIFECELYYGFDLNYRFVNPTFYCFDYFQGIIGIEFRNKEEAQTMTMKIRSQSPKMAAFEAILQERRKQQQKKKQSTGFFNKFLKQFKGQDKQEVVQEIKIISVEKKSSIAFNPITGTFDTSKIPREWEEIFNSLGLQKKDLENKQTAGFIYQEIMVYHAIKQAQEDPNQKQNIQKKLRASVRQLQLPPPPPIFPLLPPPTLLPPPPLLPPSTKEAEKPQSNRPTSTSSGNVKQDLLKQIREGGVKLKPVQAQGQNMMIDASQMNKNERDDLATHLRKELQKKKKYLARKKQQDDDDYNGEY